MPKAKTAAAAPGVKKATPPPQPPKVIRCRLPKNYRWNGRDGYIIS